MNNPSAHAVLSFDQLPDGALVSVETLAAVTCAGVSTTWRRLKSDPTAPKPVKLAIRCTRFRVGDVRRWIASKAA